MTSPCLARQLTCLLWLKTTLDGTPPSFFLLLTLLHLCFENGTSALLECRGARGPEAGTAPDVPHVWSHLYQEVTIGCLGIECVATGPRTDWEPLTYSPLVCPGDVHCCFPKSFCPNKGVVQCASLLVPPCLRRMVWNNWHHLVRIYKSKSFYPTLM